MRVFTITEAHNIKDSKKIESSISSNLSKVTNEKKGKKKKKKIFSDKKSKHQQQRHYSINSLI